MRPVFADPKTDVIFKKIFGEQAHKHLLIALLNALLELDEAHQILDVTYLSPEQLNGVSIHMGSDGPVITVSVSDPIRGGSGSIRADLQGEIIDINR